VLDLKFLDRIFSDRAEVTVDRLGVETFLHEPHVRAVIALADSRARHAAGLRTLRHSFDSTSRLRSIDDRAR
jgi:hypothetical protein